MIAGEHRRRLVSKPSTYRWRNGGLPTLLFRNSTLRCSPRTDRAFGEVMMACRAIFATKENDLQVAPVPRLFREHCLQVFLGSLNG